MELICYESGIEKKWDPEDDGTSYNGHNARSHLIYILQKNPKLVYEWDLLSNTPTILPDGFSEKECEANILDLMVSKVARTFYHLAGSPNLQEIEDTAWSLAVDAGLDRVGDLHVTWLYQVHRRVDKYLRKAEGMFDERKPLPENLCEISAARKARKWKYILPDLEF